jgi:hypothetical protein
VLDQRLHQLVPHRVLRHHLPHLHLPLLTGEQALTGARADPRGAHSQTIEKSRSTPS